MKKILVKGGAGYIGSELVQQLIERGHEPLIVDLCLFGEEPLKKVKGKYKLIKEDIREPKKEWFKEIETVCHLAGFSNDPMAAFNPEANMEINHRGTIQLAKLAKEAGVKKFIFASSGSVYDRGMTEDHENLQDENSEINLNPEYYYSISKIKAERDLKELADQNFKVYILRQGTVFGWSERMRFDLVVNTMLKTAICEKKLKVFHGGIMWRPLIDVSDVAKAYIMIASRQKEDKHFNIYNLVQDNYRILDLAHLIKKELKKEDIDVEVEVLYSKDPQRSYKISGSKIAREQGFLPTRDVGTALRKMIKEIKERKIDNVVQLNDKYYYNIQWLEHLTHMKQILENVKKIL